MALAGDSLEADSRSVAAVFGGMPGIRVNSNGHTFFMPFSKDILNNVFFDSDMEDYR